MIYRFRVILDHDAEDDIFRDLEIREGKPKYQAIVDSGISRLRPVCMAALTTILGMAPLLRDAFFSGMAITIMFGLGFATVLTLIFVPVLYAIFFKVEVEQVSLKKEPANVT